MHIATYSFYLSSRFCAIWPTHWKCHPEDSIFIIIFSSFIFCVSWSSRTTMCWQSIPHIFWNFFHPTERENKLFSWKHKFVKNIRKLKLKLCSVTKISAASHIGVCGSINCVSPGKTLSWLQTCDEPHEIDILYYIHYIIDISFLLNSPKETSKLFNMHMSAIQQ